MKPALLIVVVLVGVLAIWLVAELMTPAAPVVVNPYGSASNKSLEQRAGLAGLAAVGALGGGQAGAVAGLNFGATMGL